MRAIWLMLGWLAVINAGLAQDSLKPAFSIPKTWDAEAITSLDLPRADPALRVEHVSSEYYYSLPVRRFYKSYPVYHPSQEPKPDGKDYLAWLKEQPPQEILSDFSALKTEADWAAKGPALGKEVFEAPIADENNPLLGVARIGDVRDPAWYERAGVPFDDEGVVPFATLEDWFDRKRLEDDYVPTGWKGPPGTKTRAIRGHEFGLDLPDGERKALIAFLKTL